MSRKPIRTREELAQAAVDAFLNGDDATRQHIVDELGARATPKPPPADAESPDWS